MGLTDFGFAEQTEIFLLSVLLGGGLGVLYEFIRVLRVLFKHGRIILNAEDFFYMLLVGFSLYTFSVQLSGEIRYFTVFGLIMGWVLERFTVGNGVVFVLKSIIGWIRDKITSPAIGFITKRAGEIKNKIVENKPKFAEKKKSEQKLLKEV